MSGGIDAGGELNIREQIDRIDRAIEEAAKFRSERSNLDAEALKLTRDRAIIPWQVFATIMGAGAALFGAGAAFWKVFGN